MGYDLVTWNPRCGAEGDERWNWPGSVKLDDSEPTDNQMVLMAGDASGFSAVPTIEQINASSGINQIVALINRRILQYNSAFGTTDAILPYITESSKRKVSLYTSAGAPGLLYMRYAIDTLRSREGFVAYTWPAHFASGYRIRGSWLAHMRKALGVYGVLTTKPSYYYGRNDWAAYKRREYPWETINGEDLQITQYLGHVGIRLSSSPTEFHRQRFLASYRIPAWVNASNIVSARVGLRLYQPIGYGSIVTDLRLWAAQSLLPYSVSPAYAGSAYVSHYGQQEGLFPEADHYVATLAFGSISNYALLQSAAGGYYSTLVAREAEINDVYGTGYVTMYEDNGGASRLEIDFGS